MECYFFKVLRSDGKGYPLTPNSNCYDSIEVVEPEMQWVGLQPLKGSALSASRLPRPNMKSTAETLEFDEKEATMLLDHR